MQTALAFESSEPWDSHLFLLAPLPDPAQDATGSPLEEKRIIPFESLLDPSSKRDTATKETPIIPFEPPPKTPFKAQNRTDLVVLNQITQIQYPDTSTATLTYDQNGNMKTKGARIFTYDIDNRLVDVENNVGGSSAGDLFSATYDHRNRRFQKTEDGTSTVFAYDNMEAVQELDTAYNVQKEFVRNAFDGTPGEIIHSSTGDEVTNYNFNTVGSTTGIRKRTYPPEIIPSTPTGIQPEDLGNTTLYTEVYGNVIDDGGIFVFNPDDHPVITHVDPTSITPTQLSDTALYTEIYGTVTLDNGQYRFRADLIRSPGQDDYTFELAGSPLPFDHTNIGNRFFRGLANEFIVLEGTVVSEFAIDPATTDRANPSGVDPKAFKLGGNPLPFDHTNTKLRFFQGTGGEFYVLESQTVNEFEIDETTAIISQDDIAFSDAWGNIDSGGDLSLNNRFFNSKEVDATGLVYYGYRYYDPELGRFINRDLIGFPDGPNNYLYANGDPVNYSDKLGDALYAFDGTNNDKFNKEKVKTNVGKLHDVYIGEAFYEFGVGSRLGGKVAGGLGGAGGKRRLNRMWKALKRTYKRDKEIDIIGFSRGAALAREFANMIYKDFAKENGGVTPQIRFLGIFDTVASFGIPGNNKNFGITLSVPPNVQFVRHATAADEVRKLFPLSSVLPNPESSNQIFGKDPSKPRIWEKEFTGVHSDIGGGYEDGILSHVALDWMWREGKSVGVPFGPLDSSDTVLPNEGNYGKYTHDSRYFTDKIRSWWGKVTKNPYARKVYYYQHLRP